MRRSEKGKKVSSSTLADSSNNDSSNGVRLLNDLEALSKALAIKTRNSYQKPKALPPPPRPRSVSAGKSEPPSSTRRLNEAKKSNASSSSSSSSSIWKTLKNLTHIRHRRFECQFTLHVHSIEGLPSTFNDSSLCVHWKRISGGGNTGSHGDGGRTRPARVFQGVAEFEEVMAHRCSVYGSRSGQKNSVKYESRQFIIWTVVVGVPEMDLGKHRIDLTRLLPMTLEELEEETSSGKWSTTFKLSGKGKGGIINVSFGYSLVRDGAVSGGFPVVKTGRTDSNVDGHRPLRRSESIQDRNFSLRDRVKVEDVKVLHEILPTSKSNIFDDSVEQSSVPPVCGNVEFVASIDDLKKFHSGDSVLQDDSDKLVSFLDEPVKGDQEKNCENDVEVSVKAKEESDEQEFTVVEHGVEVLDEDQLVCYTSKNIELEESERDEKMNSGEGNGEGPSSKSKDPSKNVLLENISLENDVTVAEVMSQELDSSLSNLSHGDVNVEDPSTSKNVLLENISLENDVTVAEVMSQELDSSLSNLSHGDVNVEDPSTRSEELMTSEDIFMEINVPIDELFNEETDSELHNFSNFDTGDLDSLLAEMQTPDSPELLKTVEMQSKSSIGKKSRSLSLDDVTETVASEFLSMLGIEHSPFGLSSESEPESPRERLLKEFQMESLRTAVIESPREFLLREFEKDSAGNMDNFGSDYDSVGELDWGDDIDLNSMVHAAESELHKATQAMKSKTRAKLLEDAETEALMREWGLNEKAFQKTPPGSRCGFGSPIDLPPEDPLDLPPLCDGLGPFVQTKDGGFIRSMNPSVFKNAKNNGTLVMQVSSPVVVPAEMGSGIMGILEKLASIGIEKLSAQASKLMPLEDITGKTMQQVAWEALPSLESNESQDAVNVLNPHLESGPSGNSSAGRKKNKSKSKPRESSSQYVSLEDLAPLAMDQIEALSIEGLRIQSGMSDDDAPSNISSQSIGDFSALKGKISMNDQSVGLEGAAGLQLLDVKDSDDEVDGLMGLSLTLDEWIRLDSGIVDEEELNSDRTSKILAAHHASSAELISGGWKGDKRGGKGSGRRWGLLGNNFTVALMVQLRDPMRNYEPVGTPMLSLIQVERVFVPPKPKIYCTVSFKGNNEQDDEDVESKSESVVQEELKQEEEEVIAQPQFKITEVHVAGFNTKPGNKKQWGNETQEKSGSRWLLASGMGKSNKHALMKSKTFAKPSQSTTTAQPGDTLWSISSRVQGTGKKWKELPGLNSHIRNPNVIFPNEARRLR